MWCGPAALIQSVPQSTEQAKQESKPLLGTEASRGAPNASGVKNATLRYDLPTPAVAVRNLVRALPNSSTSCQSMCSLLYVHISSRSAGHVSVCHCNRICILTSANAGMLFFGLHETPLTTELFT